MSTESIERNITISPEAYEKIIKIMNEPVKSRNNSNNNILEELAEGQRILKELFKEDDKE